MEASVSSAAESKEISVYQNLSNTQGITFLAVEFIGSLTNDKDGERHHHSIEISTSFIQVFILEPESAAQPNDFQNGRGRTGEKIDFERTIYLEISSVAQSC